MQHHESVAWLAEHHQHLCCVNNMHLQWRIWKYCWTAYLTAKPVHLPQPSTQVLTAKTLMPMSCSIIPAPHPHLSVFPLPNNYPHQKGHLTKCRFYTGCLWSHSQPSQSDRKPKNKSFGLNAWFTSHSHLLPRQDLLPVMISLHAVGIQGLIKSFKSTLTLGMIDQHLVMLNLELQQNLWKQHVVSE